jgi:hypothetical protein
MEPVIVEISCNLDENHPKWNEIESMYIEIGYPGRTGGMLWKHIGWIKNQIVPFSRHFSHALWDKQNSTHTMAFDFSPVADEDSNEVVDKFYLKKHITDSEGNATSSKSMLVRGDFSDEMFTLKAIIPSTKNA